MAYTSGGTDPLTAGEIRTEFSVTTLGEWRADPANKGVVQCIAKRMDVVMAMEFRSAHRDECTEEQLRELQLFEEQFRNKKALRKEAIANAAAKKQPVDEWAYRPPTT